jgi:hypothetical protein
MEYGLRLPTMARNLILEVAQGRVNQYADESVSLMRRHAEAMECRDCEDYLKRGIEALCWLRKAEDMLREADAQGICPLSPELRQSINVLYSAWLRPCADADKWIEDLGVRGYVPDNIGEFRGACEEAEEIAERKDWQDKATRARLLNSSQEEW